MNGKPFAARSGGRQAILDRIRSRKVTSPQEIELDESRLSKFDDPIATFVESLAVVGGECHQVDSHGDVAKRLGEIPVFRDARRVASTVPECVAGNVDLEMLDDPHALATVDWTVARGEFAVAENGAIWIDGQTLPHRVAIFLSQYLAIVVSRDAIVDHMHQAYRRIENPGKGYGVFVSGPSKTADIEQSLVLGAHGCRTLQVFLVP